MTRPSPLERRFSELWARLRGPPLVAEYAFDPIRKWRFDFALPDLKIAFECEGAVYSAGRHLLGRGFVADCAKYNAASLQGWTLFRLPSELINPLDLLPLVAFSVHKLSFPHFPPPKPTAVRYHSHP